MRHGVSFVMANVQDHYVDLARRRLAWSGEGIDRLEALIDSFIATKPSEVITSVIREGEDAHISYVLQIYRQPTPELRFAVGEVVHNLRATLDNLVWGAGQDANANDRLGLEFHDAETKFQRFYLPKIARLPEPIRDWIESVQPYQPRSNVLCHRLNSLWCSWQ